MQLLFEIADRQFEMLDAADIRALGQITSAAQRSLNGVVPLTACCRLTVLPKPEVPITSADAARGRQLLDLEVVSDRRT